MWGNCSGKQEVNPSQCLENRKLLLPFIGCIWYPLTTRLLNRDGSRISSTCWQTYNETGSFWTVWWEHKQDERKLDVSEGCTGQQKGIHLITSCLCSRPEFRQLSSNQTLKRWQHYCQVRVSLVWGCCVVVKAPLSLCICHTWSTGPTWHGSLSAVPCIMLETHSQRRGWRTQSLCLEEM